MADESGESRRIERALREALSTPVPREAVHRHLAAIRAAGGEQRPSLLARLRIPRRVARRLSVAAAAALALSLGGGGVAYAAGDALPGDALYPVKRAVESLDLAIHRDSESRGRIHLRHASERLAELKALLERRRAGEDVDVGAAMRAYNAALTRADAAVERAEGKGLGRDLDALIEHVTAQIGKHVERLQEILADKTNERARDAIQRAIDNAQNALDRVMRGRRGERGKPDGGGAGKPEETPGRGPANRPTPGPP